MTEDEAQAWIAERFGEAAREQVARFLAMVAEENARQNLISPASIASIWTRHAVDSAQLLRLAPEGWRHWIDIGTGGGFPGMIVAIFAPDRQVTMIEPRRKRAEFLQRCTEALGLAHASVAMFRVEQFNGTADVISARAVASVELLLQAAASCATPSTTWLLPRGRSENGMVLPPMFHVEHSLTDPASMILVRKGTAT